MSSVSTKQFHRTHQIQLHQSADHDSSEEENRLNKIEECSSIPLKVTVNVNGRRIPLEVDTGAAVSIILEATCETMFPALKIYKSNFLFKTYTEGQIPLVGKNPCSCAVWQSRGKAGSNGHSRR